MHKMEGTPTIPSSIAIASEIQELVQQRGIWDAMTIVRDRLASAPPDQDLPLRGVLEILRAIVVRDLLAHPKGMLAVPRLSADFLSNFDRFNLTAQEGYLVSLIDGRLPLQKLLILSPFDHFTSLFVLARLQYQKAIEVPR